MVNFVCSNIYMTTKRSEEWRTQIFYMTEDVMFTALNLPPRLSRLLRPKNSGKMIKYDLSIQLYLDFKGLFWFFLSIWRIIGYVPMFITKDLANLRVTGFFFRLIWHYLDLTATFRAYLFCVISNFHFTWVCRESRTLFKACKLINAEKRCFTKLDFILSQGTE